jgi:hypothetical protein
MRWGLILRGALAVGAPTAIGTTLAHDLPVFLSCFVSIVTFWVMAPRIIPGQFR